MGQNIDPTHPIYPTGGILKVADFVGGCVFAVFGAVIFFASLRFPSASSGDLGPSFFPRIIAILFVVLGIFLTLSSLGKSSASIKSFFGSRTTKVVETVVLFACYIAALKLVGFIISTLVFMVVIPRLLGERRWVAIISVSVIFTAFIYFVFKTTLNVPLPNGIVFD